MTIISNKLLIVATCVLALAFTSCKKKGCTDATATNYNAEATKDDGSCTFPSTPAPITTPFTAKINGVEFVETGLTATVSTWTQILKIEATKGSEIVQIKVPVSINPGTYSFGDPDIGERGGYYNDGNSNYGAATGTGTLVIVSKTTPSGGNPGKISGTFSFTASPYSFSNGTDSYTVTDGQFMVEF